MKNEFVKIIFESITCLVTINGKKTLVSSIYRPTTHNVLKQQEQTEEFLKYYNELLNVLNSYNLPTIIFSDSNFDLHKLGIDNNVDIYADSILNNNFKQIIK